MKEKLIGIEIVEIPWENGLTHHSILEKKYKVNEISLNHFKKNGTTRDYRSNRKKIF